MTQLSIIIPVYHTEEYLEDCLQSVIGQTFPDWECLLVDDGGTDRSAAICAEFARRDPRFRLIRTAHAGTAAARNAGLRAASGEWIGFADSDDRLAPEMFAAMIRAQQESRADIVIAGFQAVGIKDEPVFYPDFHAGTPQRRVFRTPETGLLFLCDAAPWNKLFRRNFLERNRLVFPAGKCYEDVLFWNRIVRLRPTFFYLPEKIYFYRQARPGAVTAEPVLRDLERSFRATLHTAEMLGRRDLVRVFGRRFPLRAFKAAAQNVPAADRRAFIRRCRAMFRHVFRKEGACGIALLFWIWCPEQLTAALAACSFPLRSRAFVQFMKKLDPVSS